MIARRRSLVRALTLLALPWYSAGNANNHKAKYDRYWKATKKTCERDTCGHLVPDEAMNCVNECTSPGCFAEVYGPGTEEGPLEDGEVDRDRERKFTSCVRKETREARMRENKEKRERDKKEREERLEEKRKNRKKKDGAELPPMGGVAEGGTMKALHNSAESAPLDEEEEKEEEELLMGAIDEMAEAYESL
mmetsp:Transcript_46664/g.105490  ORF Transcript_46664/g.105490 Transcript_46664/m.105490 type:complete len:192 (-) Transcript_46664:150-725(-)